MSEKVGFNIGEECVRLLWANHFVPKQKNTVNKEIVGKELLVQKNPAEISGLTEEMNQNSNTQPNLSVQDRSVREKASGTLSTTLPDQIAHPPEVHHQTYKDDRPVLTNYGERSSIRVEERGCNDLSQAVSHSVSCDVPLGVVGDLAVENQEDDSPLGIVDLEHGEECVDESATAASVPLFEEDIQEESRNSAPRSRNSAPVQTSREDTGQNTNKAPVIDNNKRETTIGEKRSNAPESRNNAPMERSDNGPERITQSTPSIANRTSGTVNSHVAQYTASKTHVDCNSIGNRIEGGTVSVGEDVVLTTQNEHVLEGVGQGNVSTQSICSTI